MARRWVNFLTESAFKTATSNTQNNTTLGVSWLPIELISDDAVNFNWMPDREDIRTALARNRVERQVGTTYSLTGSGKTLLYPAQDNLLIGWGFTRNDMGGAGTTDDVPWTTTEPARDLASVIFASYAEDDALTAEKYRYDGCKCGRMALAASADNQAFELSFDFTGSQRIASDASDVEPVKTYYPSTAPYHLSDAALVVNGTTISNFSGVTIQVENELQPRKDNRTYAQPIRGWGRLVTLQVQQLYKATPDLQALFQARTALSTCTLVLTHPTGPTLTFDLKASSRITDYKRVYPIGRSHEEQYTITAWYDRTAASDMTVAFT